MKIKATVLTVCLKTTYAPFFKCGLFALTKKTGSAKDTGFIKVEPRPQPQKLKL
ncbi:hypothetical protein Lpp70_10487 [Lacticaseibacillus paracasei subsp. paracasei Lpp70]|nr:hypothetical protein Lpp70_10487 [Lacticaseibacillus paracasei subsp. paracasei Lpp70]OUC68100.1 hypothetical protein BLL69_1537c [Lacticaseibacillus paracasei]